MIIFPAIDLLDGKCVRLEKGDYKKVTIYNDNPIEQAKIFEKNMAKYLHIVDLQASKNGIISNFTKNIITKIKSDTKLKIQIGGGIRQENHVDYYINHLFVDRVIIGTKAVSSIEFINNLIQKYTNEKIVISVDIKDGFVAVNGWMDKSNFEYMDFLQKLQDIGVKYVLVTDISRDGMMSGANFDLYKEISEKTNLNVIISGGVKDIEDIKKAKQNKNYGIIIGRALYNNAIDLTEAIKYAD